MGDIHQIRLAFWVLAYGIGAVFIMALVTDYMHGGHSMSSPRLGGLVLIGTMALVWVWLTGKKWRREAW